MKSVEQNKMYASAFLADQTEKVIVDELQLEADLKAHQEAYKGLAIKILAGLGGLVGSGLFCVFLQLAFDPRILWLLIGAIGVSGALFVDRSPQNNTLDSVSLGCYLVGFVALGAGVNQLFHSDSLTILVLLTVAFITLVYAKSPLLYFFSTAAICGCLYAYGNANNIPQFIHVITLFTGVAYVVFNIYEAHILIRKHWNVRYEAINAGLLVSFLALLLDFCFHLSRSTNYPWISSVIIMLLTFWFISKIIHELRIQSAAILIYGLSSLVLLPLIFAPAIGGAILVMMVGFHTGRKLALTLGIIGLIYFTGQLYYDLKYTLLVKSIIMFGTGLLCLAVYFLLQKKIGDEKEQ